jgi:membrane protease YdiL (CAAX protease family)
MTTMIQANRNSPLLAILGIGLAVPFFEELIFRGWLYKRLELVFTPTIAVLATSLVFTLIHVQYNAYILSALFVLALILGMMRQRSGSIWPGVLLHCLNNTIATLIAFSSAPQS